MGQKYCNTSAGFTLIELMVVIAIGALIITLTAPSAVEFIRIQRIKSIASEIASDIQYARGETLRLRSDVWIKFNNNTQQTCYTTFRSGAADLYSLTLCNCTNGEGIACQTSKGAYFAGLDELKTISLSRATNVAISTTGVGAIKFLANQALPGPGGDQQLSILVGSDASHSLQVSTNLTGRPQICVPLGSNLTGFQACE